MKVLFTTPILEHPAAGGPQLRIENSIKALNTVAELHVVSRAPRCVIGGESAASFYQAHCAGLVFVPFPELLGGNRYLVKLQEVANRLLDRDADLILRYAEARAIRIIWFGYGNISHALMKSVKRQRPDIQVVCDTDSVWSRFVLRGLPYEDSPLRRRLIERNGKQKQREESEWVDFCDVTTAVSEVDAAYYRGLTRYPERIKIFSNVIDLKDYEEVPEPPQGLRKPCMYLAGSFGPRSPMDRAARWVIEEVLPLVRQKVPDAHFYIIGRGSDTTLANIKDPAVTVTGKLRTVLPYLYHADVALVPLMFESGTRFKILEAAACGVPIVTTTLGAEGIPVVDGENVLMADEPKQFAEAIVRLVRDNELAKRMARSSRDLVRSNYGLARLVREAEVIVRACSNPQGLNR